MRLLPSAYVTVRHLKSRRAMALLLVMIGLIVCTILTAGFLATQGTSIGIARNERDASKSRHIAQSGIDMCYWLMRNRTDWREGMTPGGKWLNNVPVGDGTVTVTVDKEFAAVTAPAGGIFGAASSSGAAPYVTLGSTVTTNTVVCTIGATQVQAGASGTIAKILVIDGQSVSLNQTLFLVKPPAGGSFADDPTQGVTLTSVGSYDNRSYTLLATIHPTGGGTVFNGGNFVSGKITLGSSLLTTAVIDSYNSLVAVYNAVSPGSNAAFGSNSTASGALTVTFPSIFRGTYTAAVGSILSDVLSLLGLAPGPSAVNTALETRTPGTVIFPNTSGIGADHGNLNYSGGVGISLAAPGYYDNLVVSGTQVNVGTSGTYSFANVTLGSTPAAWLNVRDGTVVNLIVRGNLVVNTGQITLGNNSQLNIYASSNVTISNGAVNNNGNTSHVMLYGGSSGGNIILQNANAVVYGAIYAPQHNVTLQTSTPKLFGAVVASSFTVKDSAAFHFDEALRSLKISNVTGGSAAPGTSDYRINIIGGTGVAR